MDLKKRKHFTSKKEDNFFLFCFSFQTRKDLALVKFYNVAVRCFFDNWLGGIYTLCNQDRKNSSAYNVCFIFEDN